MGAPAAPAGWERESGGQRFPGPLCGPSDAVELRAEREEETFIGGRSPAFCAPPPTPAPQEEAGSPLPQVRTATLRESCTSPAAGPRPTSPGRGPLGGGKPVPGSRPRLRVAQPVGSQKVTLLRPQGTRGQGTQAGEQVSAAHAPE